MKKPTKTTLRNKLDTLFSKIIRTRDKRCMRCGKRENIQCAHVMSRDHLAGRWNELNALALCPDCHINFAHHEPVLFASWLKVTHPAVWEESRIIKQTVWQPKIQDYQDLFEELTARLAVLERKE